MRARAAARRLPAFALVVVAHGAALIVFVMLTRTQLVHAPPEANPILVVFVPESLSPQSQRPPSKAARAWAHSKPVATPTDTTPVQPPGPAPGSTAIDWAAAAQGAAAREAARDDEERRRAMAQRPRPSPALAPPVHRPEFHWDHARTHRVEPLAGGGSLLNLNDNCVLVVIGMIPFPTCKLGKLPARGDLFDHMHEAPEFGAWKDK